ncbi:FecR family protein [uncultured Fibrella sp.]|uniref:FecR family protein n=1 Tax=uncultured Fibrella sp. TaxID=1284596 RepID=UPI0035CB2179
MDLPPDSLSTIEDFLENAAFREWALGKRPQDRLFWEQWLFNHPEKRELYEQAVAALLVIQGEHIVISSLEISDQKATILNRSSSQFTSHRPSIIWQWGRWLAAAAVFILVLWWQSGGTLPAEFTKYTSHSGQVADDPVWQTVSNGSGQPLVVFLPDNSSVLLSAGSQLRFQKKTNHPLREVYLQGEGFFEVTKNPAKPFMVYTASLTTKVLGTSFQVRSFTGETTAYVKVKTGRVEVSATRSQAKPILLTVNEELDVKPKTKQLIRHEHFLADEKPSTIMAQEFTFNYTAVPDVLDKLEANYHMPIRYDRALTGQCTFTGNLDDMPFLEKIRLVCLTIDSSFEVIDNQVIIHSKGCN